MKARKRRPVLVYRIMRKNYNEWEYLCFPFKCNCWNIEMSSLLLSYLMWINGPKNQYDKQWLEVLVLSSWLFICMFVKLCNFLHQHKLMYTISNIIKVCEEPMRWTKKIQNQLNSRPLRRNPLSQSISLMYHQFRLSCRVCQWDCSECWSWCYRQHWYH